MSEISKHQDDAQERHDEPLQRITEGDVSALEKTVEASDANRDKALTETVSDIDDPYAAAEQLGMDW